jgi:hypothetical protein
MSSLPTTDVLASQGASSGWLCVTAAKGIQGYILGSDRLRDIVGATEIIDRLPCEALEEGLKWLRLEGKYEFISRAAGAARIWFERENDAREFARWWPLICAHAAPGLEVVQCVQSIVCDGTEDYLAAVRAAEEDLSRSRSRGCANLPEISPAVLRAQRTGLAAVERFQDENVDFSTQCKALARRANRQDAQSPDRIPDICRRIGFPEGKAELVPKEFEQISGSARDYLAVIHADGNGMGGMFVRLEEELKKLPGFPARSFYKALSAGIITAGDNAAQAGVQKVRKQLDAAADEDKPWPLLPIVLAGDDLTVVIRADLAIDYVDLFLKGFEGEIRKLFVRLGDHFGKDKATTETLSRALESTLTAGAGIAFVKPRYPFSRAYELCESLAKFAKGQAKGSGCNRSDGLPPSTIAFHRVTAATTQHHFADLLKGELRGADEILLSMAPYVVGDNAITKPFPTLNALRELTCALLKVPRGQTRELFSLLQADLARAEKHYERLISRVPGDPEATRHRSGLSKAFARMLSKNACYANGRTPLGDALTLAGFDPRLREGFGEMP